MSFNFCWKKRIKIISFVVIFFGNKYYFYWFSSGDWKILNNYIILVNLEI